MLGFCAAKWESPVTKYVPKKDAMNRVTSFAILLMAVFMGLNAKSTGGFIVIKLLKNTWHAILTAAKNESIIRGSITSELVKHD